MSVTVADETAGDIPVRDITLNLNGASMPVLEKESLLSKNARARQAVAKVSRDELEDRYLRLQEEHLLLKQHTHKQEDKIKRMATKLIRLVKDRKRVEQVSSTGRIIGGRDVEMEEMIEELQEKVQELEKQNEGLKQRLLTAKQQLQTQSRRPTPYSHIQSRINSGLHRFREDSPASLQQPQTPSGAGTRHVEGEMSIRPPLGLLPRYGHSLLDEARSEIRNMENVIESQRAQIEEMERSTEMLRDQLSRKEREYEESVLHLREQQTSGQRSTIKENVEMIKLQKHLAEKGNAFTVLEGRFFHLQQNQKTLKASHEAAMAKVDELTGQLKEERLRALGLESQLHTKTLEQKRADEMLERIQDLEKERDLLKENCDKLVNSAFDISQEQKWKTREQQLKLQIAQLEMALKSDLTDKNQILDKIKAERDLNENLMQENKELQLRYLDQKQQLDEIKDRMKFFSKESELDAVQLSEALMLIKVRKTQNKGDLGFLEKVETEVHMDVEHSMKELQAIHAETVQELEKTRNMLIIQHKINKDYQAEVEAVTRKMDDLKLENELKQEKLGHLLDMRAAKIKKLEAQLKDIAYGTKAHIFRPDMTDDCVTDEFDETVHLARGENLMEIYLGTAQFSVEALESLGDKDPSTFCTYAFYDFELQSTAVVRGPQPTYNFTSQYLVKVDDLFLHYLHSNSITVELQLAEGLTFRTIAAGQMHLIEVLEGDGKVFGTLQLVGVSGEIQVFGTLDYWLRLRVPMEQAIRLYKERAKAQGYLTSNLRDQSQALTGPPSSSTFKDGNLNELYITVHHCSNLKSRGPHGQPSPYVIYKLYDFPDHDTMIIPSTDEPQFEDHVTFPMAMNSDLDVYLRSEALILYVFDDQDLENQLYLGKAKVPLISLAHDKAITGTFELMDPAGLTSGYIDVTLKWKFTYLPPSGSAMTPEQAKFIVKESPMKLAVEKVGSRNGDEERQILPLPLSTPETPLPKPRLHTLTKAATKKVSFLDVTELKNQIGETTPPSGNQETKPSAVSTLKTVRVVEVGQASTGTEEEEDDSHFSEGQVIAVNSQSVSDDSEISEELQEPEEDIQQDSDLSESILSDSDDCIVPAQNTQSRKQPSERIRVEIVSLSLKPDCRVSVDSSVVRLFVEHCFLDLPSVETPLSLPKPLPGHSIYYNYSNVIHVDVENNQARRNTLRAVLEGRSRNLENIRFTVVSDPPEEEEQEKECEDVGVAYLHFPDILKKQKDMTDVSLDIVDVQDSSEVVGSLKVTVEALEALRSIMEDPHHDHSFSALR
ncbi:protein fantom isoform X1 [Electrophorus electricus]|uniref:protein fantom isoform X1 n=1 Tax=Electrophorus electricus TaxID=8005 RepID=UPI0015CF8E25|nr:protein fantom isoform X1 [Electrophorus electricus]